MRSEITYLSGLSPCFPVQCLKESCFRFSLYKPFRVLQTARWWISSRPLWPTLAGASTDITCRSSVEWTCSSVVPIASPNRGAEPLILSLVAPNVIRKTWVPQRPLQPGPWTAMSSAIRKPACNYITNQLLLHQCCFKSTETVRSLSLSLSLSLSRICRCLPGSQLTFDRLWKKGTDLRRRKTTLNLKNKEDMWNI